MQKALVKYLLRHLCVCFFFIVKGSHKNTLFFVYILRIIQICAIRPWKIKQLFRYHQITKLFLLLNITRVIYHCRMSFCHLPLAYKCLKILRDLSRDPSYNLLRLRIYNYHLYMEKNGLTSSLHCAFSFKKTVAVFL